MADLALWDLVAPYFLLGDAAGEWHAALSVIAVEAHDTASDVSGTVIRGRARIHGDVDVVVDPANLSIRAVAGNTEGHPRDDPGRRAPWIDLRDTTIDFQLLAPREGSATIVAGDTLLVGDAAFAPTKAVLDAWDTFPVDTAPSDYPSSSFVLDLLVTSAVLRPPLLNPAQLRADGCLEPHATASEVRITLPRIKIRASQASTPDARVVLQLLSLGASGMDDPGDIGVAQMVTMDPPHAFIGPGRTVGFGFRTAVLDLSDGSTPPDVLAQFGFDEEWTGVHFPEIRLFVAPQGAEGLAVDVGVENLLVGIGASSGVTGDFSVDVINQGEGPLTIGARFYRQDGTGIGIVRTGPNTADATLPARSRIVVDVAGGRRPHTTTIEVDGGGATPDRTREIDLTTATQSDIVVRATAPGSTDAELTITARRAATTTPGATTTTGHVPDAVVTASSASRGGSPVEGPLVVIESQTTTTVTLRQSDRSAADWTVDGNPVGASGSRQITVPLAADDSIDVRATGPGTTTKCPVYFRFDEPDAMTDVQLAGYATNADLTHTGEAVDETTTPATWTSGGPVATDGAYRLALESLPADGSILVVGHASFEDDDSKAEYNRLLSERRAKVARTLYEQLAPGRVHLTQVDERGFSNARPQQEAGDPRRRWWRAELPNEVTVPGSVTTATVVRGPAPTAPTPVPVPPSEVAPSIPPKPDFLRSIGVKVRIVRDEFVAVELHGEVDFDTAAEEALRDKAPADDVPTFAGLGSQNPGDGIVAFRGVFTRNPGDDEWALTLTFGADPSDVDGLLMTGAPAGQLADRSPGRDVLGLYTLFLPLIAAVAPETPGDAEVGDLVLAGASATLPLALAGTGWFTVERVVWYGGEVRVLQRHGGWSTAVLADVEVAVSADITLGGESIVRIRRDAPLTARYKAVGIRFGQRPDGELLLHPVFDSAKGYTIDIARNGSLEVAEPLGSILKVVGARMSRTNPVFFEIELGGAADLGVVSLDTCSVRVTLDGLPPTVELTSLGASVDIPGTLTGSGYFSIAEDGFAGRIDLTLLPLKLRVAAALNVRNIPATAGGPATAVAVAMQVEFPVAIPLANSGLGIYGFIGLFAMHFTRNEAADSESTTRALSWLRRADGDPTKVDRPDLWKPEVDHWAFGVGMIVGTMGSDLIFNMKGLVVLELPGPRLLLMMKANVLFPAPELKSDAEGTLLAVVDLDMAQHTLTIGIAIDFAITPILRLRIPVEVFFDTDEPTKWHLYLGKFTDQIRAEVLLVFKGSGYLMFVGDGSSAAGDLNPDLPRPPGFLIAAGLHVSMLWGSRPARLYAELAAGFDAILGFQPLLVAGKLYARGELRLFIISIAAYAELDVRLGELPDGGGDGYEISGEVCGSISFFFFDIEGCVSFSLEDGAVPDLIVPPLVKGVSLVSRSPGLAQGTAADQPVDVSLAEAVAGPTEPDWNGLPDEIRDSVTNVPIDAIPAIAFTAPPFDRAHPGVARPTLTFQGTDVQGTSGGRTVTRSSDSVTYEVESVVLDPPAGGGPTPATWWTLRPPNEANEGVHLALLSWVPNATPNALVRSETLDEVVHDRWGTVCSDAAPPQPVLWTFRHEPLGPDPRGWTLVGEPWPDPPATVRSAPPPDSLEVEERWRCGDPVADRARGIAPAHVVGAIVGCPEERDPEPAERPPRPFRIADAISRRRPEALDEATVTPTELVRRLAVGHDIGPSALGSVVDARPVRAAPNRRTCDSRVLAAPRFDRLEPVPRWNASMEAEVRQRWRGRRFDPGDLADALVVRPGRFEYVRVLLFVTRRLIEGGLVVRATDAEGNVVDEHVVDSSDVVSWLTLPSEWTDPAGPWDDDVMLVMQHLSALEPREHHQAVLAEITGNLAADRVVIGVPAEVAIDLDLASASPAFHLAAVEALAGAETDRHAYDTSTVRADHDVLEAALSAGSAVALLKPGTSYQVSVTWSASIENAAGDSDATSATDHFWFRTAATAPDRLDPWVLCGTPYEGERHVFGAEPLQLSFNTANVIDLFEAYGYRLEVRLLAASGQHPDPITTGIPHPLPLDAASVPVAASVLSPWEGTLVDAIATPGFGAPAEGRPRPCIEVDGDRTQHTVTTIPIPLHAATDYLLDIERVPAAAPAGTRGERIFRRSFTTSQFGSLADLAELVRASRVVHRYAPIGAMAAIAGAVGDLPAGEELDLAFEAAGLGRFPMADRPQVLVFWEGHGTPQPTGVLLDANEPLWRTRERAVLVPVPDTDVRHYELRLDPWIAPERAASSTTPVTRTIRAPGGQRGLLVLGPAARGTRLQVDLRRRAFPESYLDGPASTDDVERLADIAFLAAPWEEQP